jgi:hypothetical protein
MTFIVSAFTAIADRNEIYSCGNRKIKKTILISFVILLTAAALATATPATTHQTENQKGKAICV